MTEKNEWKAAHDELLSEARSQAEEPPTFDEVLALMHGQLPEDDAERVRKLLVVYPELAQAVVAPVPEGVARPQDADFVSDAEMARRWSSLQGRIGKGGTVTVIRRIRMWQRASLALAAALVLAVGGLLAQAALHAKVERGFREPRVVGEEQLLTPDRHRGGGETATIAAADGEWYVLSVSLIDAQSSAFRLQIVDTKTSAVLWRSSTLRRRENDTFMVQVPRSLLKAGGKYQVVVYSVEGATEERLESYSFVATSS